MSAINASALSIPDAPRAADRWLLSEEEADAAAKDLLELLRKLVVDDSEWARWEKLLRTVTSSILGASRPDLTALEQRLLNDQSLAVLLHEHDTQRLPLVRQPLLQLLFRLALAVTTVLNSIKIYNNTLAFPDDQVHYMIDSVLLLTMTAAVDPTSTAAVARLRHFMVQPTPARVLKSWLTASRQDILPMVPPPFQEVLDSPVEALMSPLGPFILQVVLPLLQQDMQRELRLLATRAAQCGRQLAQPIREMLLMFAVKDSLSHNRGGGADGSSCVRDEQEEKHGSAVVVSTGLVLPQAEETKPADDEAHVSRSVVYVLRHAPLHAFSSDLMLSDKRLDDSLIVSLHVLQSSTTSAEKQMQQIENALRLLQPSSQRWLVNDLVLLRFTHVSLLATSAAGHRLLLHKLKKGVVYVFVPASFEPLDIAQLASLAHLEGRVAVRAFHQWSFSDRPQGESELLDAAAVLALPERDRCPFESTVTLYELLEASRAPPAATPFAAQSVCIHFLETMLRSNFPELSPPQLTA